ncbi:MAG: hypothetical protein M0C28_13165 [Candidatus Moduliflexus flocculans]|nr:hypothetical protein [Candidatus Moduliflexus flocculans]
MPTVPRRYGTRVDLVANACSPARLRRRRAGRPPARRSSAPRGGWPSPLKKPAPRQRHEVLGGQRRVEHGQLDLDGALVGVEEHVRRHLRRDQRRRGVRARRRVRAPAGSAAARRAAGSSSREQRGRAQAHRPVLVAERLVRARRAPRPAVLRERVERRGARLVRARRPRRPWYAAASAAVAARRLQLAQAPTRRPPSP